MESINEALIDAVKSLGGSKQVGPVLWPEKAPDAAQRLLLACLNEDRPERLSPDHLMLILRKARAKGCHSAFEFMAAELGYTRPSPVEPMDELAELQRQFINATEIQAKLVARMERMQKPQLRSAA